MSVTKTTHPRLHREPRSPAPAPSDSPLRRHFGWLPDLPDQRDYKFAAEKHVDLKALPPRADLRPGCPAVYDQGQLGSCTGNAIAGAIQYDRRRQKLPDWTPSRLFIYYNERAMEGTVSEDAGAAIRDGIKSIARYGAPPESDWPYNIARFTKRPSAKAYSDAMKHKAVTYQRIFRSQSQMCGCLAAGLPFVFGFTVYESFESDQVAQTGVVPMPGSQEGVLGGHAVLAVGYDGTEKRFLCRNSWGTGWGLSGSGYFTLPYDYLLNSDLADDMWVVQTVK